MKTRAGVWIDHRGAVIVSVNGGGLKVRRIPSNIRKHAATGPHSAFPDDLKERSEKEHLNHYFDGVIACLLGVESVYVFGPGEAKGELRKRMQADGSAGRIGGFETAHKLSEREISAKVQKFFQPQYRRLP